MKDLQNDDYDQRSFDTYADKVESLLQNSMRPANTLITNVQICLMFWIAGKVSKWKGIIEKLV